MKYILFAAGGVVVVAGLWLWAKNEPQEPLEERQIIAITGQELEVEVARTPQEQSRGLSGKESLADNAGMLFVYGQPTTPAFWMPDMNFALDIIWIDESGVIIGIAEKVAPESYPELFSPPAPVQYVLEVNAGWSAAHGVTAGDDVFLDF